MILRLRQLCCHPNLILVSRIFFSCVLFSDLFLFGLLWTKCQADGYDPTMLVSGESEKDLARARKVMGSEWVAKLKRRYVYL